MHVTTSTEGCATTGECESRSPSLVAGICPRENLTLERSLGNNASTVLLVNLVQLLDAGL